MPVRKSVDWSEYDRCTRKWCFAAAGEPCRKLSVRTRHGFDRPRPTVAPHVGRPPSMVTRPQAASGGAS